jgi:hypothetical protein
MKGRVILSVFFAVLLMSACQNTSKKSEEFVLADADSLSASFSTVGVADEEILRNFSSPIEMANLFQVMGIPFTQEYLASSLDASELTSSFDKSLWLGILGADLGYLNVYGKTGTSMDLLSSIKKLAEGLRVGQFFDFETIKRLSVNSSNFDSLLYLSINSYNNIDRYLREYNRSQLSSLMIIGAWIETQYFATQVMKQHPDDLLRDRIGEQKYFLNSLIRLAAPYCGMNDQFRTLCNYLRNIAAKYDHIIITNTPGNPISSEKDGGLVITQTETSKVEMTEGQLAEIIEITSNVRNKLIVNN